MGTSIAMEFIYDSRGGGGHVLFSACATETGYKQQTYEPLDSGRHYYHTTVKRSIKEPRVLAV